MCARAPHTTLAEKADATLRLAAAWQNKTATKATRLHDKRKMHCCVIDQKIDVNDYVPVFTFRNVVWVLLPLDRVEHGAADPP